MKLDGFGIFVKDMPTMVRFYRNVSVENYAAVDKAFDEV